MTEKEIIENNLEETFAQLEKLHYNLYYLDLKSNLLSKYDLKEIKRLVNELENAINDYYAKY